MSHLQPPNDLSEEDMRRMTRRGFTVAGVAVLGAVSGWRWLVTRELDDGIPWPLRRVLQFNERIGMSLFRATHLSPEFPKPLARIPRVNGAIGLDPAVNEGNWSLKVHTPGQRDVPRNFRLDEIKAMPRVEITSEFKCIEGWSCVVHWAGTRLASLAAKVGISGNEPATRYVAASTSNGGYYTGLDIESALHPQTLLVYEMNGQPLTHEHGAPLRLVVPVKYGIKSLKQVGTIRFTDHRPVDYWAERGYDWYAGL